MCESSLQEPLGPKNPWSPAHLKVSHLGCGPFQAGAQYDVSGGDQEMSHENKVYVTCAAGYGTVDDIRLVESECQDGEWTPLAVSCGRSCSDFVAASWKCPGKTKVK